MTKTLLIRLEGPLQSWGSKGRHRDRTTELMPTKSGVIGLCAAALGWSRDTDLSPLAKLKMGVRIDAPGELLRDYHIAGIDGIMQANGKLSEDALPTNRWYLQDAAFLVGLEGDDDLLEEVYLALQKPMFPLHLGRKACPPSMPVWNPGIVDGDLEKALQEASPLRDLGSRKAELWLEHKGIDGVALHDQPMGSVNDRKYGRRTIRQCNSIVLNPETDKKSLDSAGFMEAIDQIGLEGE